MEVAYPIYRFYPSSWKSPTQLFNINSGHVIVKPTSNPFCCQTLFVFVETMSNPFLLSQNYLIEIDIPIFRSKKGVIEVPYPIYRSEIGVMEVANLILKMKIGLWR